MGENKVKPYADLEVTDDYIIREFSENIDPYRINVASR